MKKKLLTFFALIFSVSISFGQIGKIAGKITDDSNNAPLANASIISSHQQVSGSSDFEGAYSLDLPEGTYDVVVRYIGYMAKEIKDIVVKSGSVTELDVTLIPESGMIADVVVSVSARKNTEASILNMQKNAGVLMDGLSSQSIKRTGASDIASAIRTVPGVSVQEGKFIYVRGLGDRYTKSTLNGVDIPGLDPDKNTIQMDIFPTNILENIIVVKSGSADLPADFTGGVVDIVTKDFPTRKQMGVSFSLGANPAMNFNKDYLSYPGGKTDFLGFDDGTRKLPFAPNTEIPNPASSDNSTLEGLTRSLNPTMGATNQTSLPNFSLGFNFGNQYQLGNNKLGVIASIDYSNSTNYFSDFRNGIYQKPGEPTDYEILVDRRQRGRLGVNNVLGSALLGFNYKTDRSKYAFNILHVQNGESRAAVFQQATRISNVIDVVRDNLEYTQRSISNFLLSGKHSNEDGSFMTEWKVSPTFSRIHDKDVRLTSFRENIDGSLSINSDSGFPVRMWRNLSETNVVNKVDFTKKHSLFDNNAFLKFGALYSFKQRDYSINNYDIGNRDVETRDLQGNPNNILLDQNIWTPETNSGYFIRGNFQAQNTFDAAQHTAAAYVSSEFRTIEKLRTIVGLRAEKFMTYFTGQNNSGTEIYNNEKTIDKLDLFPSLNLIYGLNAQNNVRLSYSRTTARPSFKELSIVQIPDLLTGVNFLGNIDLQPTYINNFDLRYEMYGERAQMFAVSAFYKQFKNPIEIVAYSSTAPNDFTPRNTSEAQVFGVEFEVRKNFGFLHEGLKDLSLNANVSLVHSVIEMSKTVGGEYESRQAFARADEEIEDTRLLQGQSPYLINAGLSYNNAENGLETGIFYNVQGKTLDVVGFGKNPDVYVQPFNSLNFNFSKRVGVDNHGSINVKAENILGAERKSLYESYKANTQEFLFRAPGRTFSIGYSYNF